MLEPVMCDEDVCEDPCCGDDAAFEKVSVNLVLPDDIVELVKKGRDSTFGKRLVRTLLDSKSDMRINTRDCDNQNHFFLELFGVQAATVGIYGGSKVSIGDRKIEAQWNQIDTGETLKNLYKAFSKCFYIRAIGYNSFRFWSESLLVNLRDDGMEMMYDPASPKLLETTVDCIVPKPFDGTKTIAYIVYNNGFGVTSLKVKKQDCDVKSNYNDDLPDERIVNWINSDDSGVVVLHGDPGTGKTSYIRNLIYKTDNKFLFFDKSIFQHMSEASLIELLINRRNSVIILEDCEDLLTNRTGFGSCMGTILNLTDGILGDSMKFKFICTFNANIVDIDPAILRKGRMRLKYEFKKLTGKKARALGEKLGIKNVPEKEMPLCDVYNYLIDNGNSKKESKVGF